MTKKLFYILVPLLILQAALVFSMQIVDEIRAVVYTDGEPQIILESSIKPRLDGTPRTLRDFVLEFLMLEDAARLNLSVTEEDVERFFVDIQKRNNGISREQLEAAMLEQGYTSEEGKEQIRRNHLIGQVLSIRTKSDKKMIIQKEDVEKFYTENPIYEDATYTLHQTIVPGETDINRQFGKAELDAFEWKEFLTINDRDLADDMGFIVAAQIGTIVDREVDNEGLELTRLIRKTEKKQIALEDVYDQIMMILSEKAFNELKMDYEKKLLSEASIRFTYPEDEIAVMGEFAGKTAVVA